MRLKPKFWWSLSLLFFAAAIWLWHAGDRMAASRRAAAISSGRPAVSVVSGGSAPTAPTPAPAPRTYRLSNTPQTLAQLGRNPRAILLRNALIDTSLRVKLAIPEPLRSHGAPGSYLVQSDRPLNDEFYAALRHDGAEFVSYIPNNTALVRATAEAARTMVADRLFQAVLPYEPYFKLDGSLLPGAVNGEMLTNKMLRVTVLPGQDAAAAQALAALGANVTDREPTPFGSTTFIVTAPPDQLVAVAQLPQTQEIESFSPRHTLNDQTRARLGVATNTIARTNYQGLTGTNIWMGLADTGVDATHQDFSPANKRLAGATTDPDGHGTHVAATMVGGGNESSTVSNAIPGSVTPNPGLFRGMAPQASLFVQSVDLWTGPYISDAYLQSNASFMMTSNAVAANASLGTDKFLTNGFVNNYSLGYQSTVYDLPAASYDGATRNAQPNVPGEHSMLYVVAAGNGNQGAGTISSPGTAKNVITASAIDSPRFITNTPQFKSTTFYSNFVAPFSSAGNVGAGIESEGGRFKPDVVAPGCFTISARASGYQDPTAQEVLAYGIPQGGGGTLLPGQANIYKVTLVGPTTNLIVQVLPNQFSPVPFPTNLIVYFGVNDPPVTPPTGSNAAGLPEWANPVIGDNYLEIASPANQPWPVAYDLRIFGIETNNVYSNYYGVLKSNLNANLLPYYRYESGTSMAAAAVSGMLGLMQDFLHNTETLKLTPSPALLKALLINGSRPLNQNSDLNPAPALNLEGYGLPNLANSIPVWLTTNTFYDQNNALQTGESHNYTVNINTNLSNGNATNAPLRITLVWTDPPGNPAAGLALVNDLDLVVTDSQSNIYIGNNFLPGDIYTELSSTTNMAASDTVNNVENVFIDATYGLLPPYTITVKGTHVNVNADTRQTNIIGQDYALVISSDYTTNVLTVSDGGTVQQAATAPVTSIGNGMVLLHQRVGANPPNLAEYPGGLYPYPGDTNGNLVQWRFYTFANINYMLTNTNAFNVTNTIVTNGTTNITVTNLANLYSNAIFATFLPATLTIPVSSPLNPSYPAAQNADIDLYVSTNPALFQLDTNALAGAHKELGQGGNEMVLFPNIVSNAVLYIAVKSETQQGADYELFATLATNFDNGLGSLNDNQPVTVSAYALPVTIPDSYDTGGEEGAQVLAFVTSPIMVRKVQVTVGIQHENPSDLYGTLSHGGQDAVLNHYSGEPGGFTNTYDDAPEGETSPYPIIPSDSPGSLQNFVGMQGSGQWLLNEKDSVFTQTGLVTMLTLTIWPQPPLAGVSGGGLDYTNSFPLETNGTYYGYVDVPNDATNLEIGVFFTNAGPVGIFLTNQGVPDTGDYGTNVSTPGQWLDLSTNPTTNGPPLSGGRWYYLITNESGVQMTITEFVIIQVSGTPNLALTVFSGNTPTPLTTDAHTLSEICITNGILSSNQQLASLQVGVCISNASVGDLVLYLTSPQGTSMELFDQRGGPQATNLGLTATNGSLIYLTFTDNAGLAPQLVKFFPPPFGQLLTNVDAAVSSFETVPRGDYGQTNGLFPVTLGTNLEVWTVVSNDVAVVGSEDLYQAANGTNYLALADGVMTATIPTAIGQAYTLTYNYRGPGLVDWWLFEGDFNDIIGTNNGTLTAGGPVTNISGEVGQGIQFPSSSANPQGADINFGPNAGNFGTNDFTIDYWMKTSSTNSIESVLDKRGVCNVGIWWGVRIGIGINPAGLPVGPGRVGFECDDGTAAGLTLLYSTMQVNDGRWHHLAWTRRGAVYSSYVDGLPDLRVTAPDIADLNDATPLRMGVGPCDGADGSQPYTGAMDELDIWNRALTDVEIAALYQTGAKHLSKATPVSIYPNSEIVVTSGTDTITNTLIVTNASGTNWMTNMVYFTALGSNTTITLQGNPLGMLFDDFVLQTPANLNYVQPEEQLAPLIGQNPDGCWTLDVWDTRSDSAAPTNGVLLSWNLQMTVSSTNASLIVLTNHIQYAAGSVGAGSIAYFAFDVPAGVNFVTNTLSGSTNLNLLFNQTALPVGNQMGDFTLLAGVTNGVYVLSNNAPPPTLLAGERYFLGVQNTSSVAATFTIEVDTNVLTAPAGTVVLTNAIPYTNVIASSAPQYYSFYVPPGSTFASFYITNIFPATNELDLYARNALPMPTDTTFDYDATFEGTSGEAIVITNNSVPVPLTSGNWYLTVYNYNTNTSNNYTVVATTGSNTPAAGTNAIVSVTGMSVSASQFTLRWATAPGSQYAVDISSDLIHWTNAAGITAIRSIGSYTDPAPVASQAVRFYRVLNLPAGVLPGMSVSANQFTLKWAAASGAQYQLKTSTDLIHWTTPVSITTEGATGTYSEPVNPRAARFYQVIRTQ